MDAKAVRRAPECVGLGKDRAGPSQQRARFFQALLGFVAHLGRFFPNGFSLFDEPCGCAQDFCKPLFCDGIHRCLA